MKKLSFIYVILATVLFFGCENLYLSDSTFMNISEKRTHKTFDDLDLNPIVLTMPVYEYSYLLGNKKWNSKCKVNGDIFVIFDCSTNSVYDWCYFEQSEYVTDGRTVEQNFNGNTAYYNFGYWSDKVAWRNCQMLWTEV